MKYFHSLTFKLIAIGVLLLIAGSSLRYLLMESTLRSGIVEVVNAHQLSLARVVAQDIENKMLARRQVLTQLAADAPLAMLQDRVRSQAWLDAQATALQLFPGGLALVGTNGLSTVATQPLTAAQDFTSQEWFVAARDGTDFAVGKPTLSASNQTAVLNLAVPVRDGQQRVVAVLMGATPLAAPGFLDLMETGNVGRTGSLLLVSPRDQLFVTASEPAMRLKPLPPPGINPMHDQAMEGWRGAGVTRNAQGSEELSAVVSVPSANWFLVARTPSTEAFQVVRTLIEAVVRNSLKVSAVLVIALVLLLTWVFRPLKESAIQMRAMAHGATPLAHLPVVRQDEVGAMVTSFNELVDKLLQSESRMRYLAHHDALTSLPNRMAFQQNLAQSVALADRQQAKVALLFIDLDGFKSVNDNCGHDVGDQLLVQVAARLRACVRASDVVGRLGGDEFVLLLTDDPSTEQAAHIADKVIEAVRKPYDILDAQPKLGASIGIAMYPDQAQTADQLLIMADSAMYVAKRAGGGRQHLAA